MSIRITSLDRKTRTPYFNPEELQEKELSKWTIKQLLLVAEQRREFKQCLINFLKTNKP